MAEIIQMENGKIYYISYGGTTLIVRFKESDTTQHNFYAQLHYWNGWEKFLPGGYGVKHGIEEVRRATDAEKHALLRFEIANNTI